MKRIFTDLATNYIYSVFVELTYEQKNKAYFNFAFESEQVKSDIVIVDSFDELINFEKLFEDYILKRIKENRPIIFIIETVCEKSEKPCRNFEEVCDVLYICDSEYIHELISSMIPPVVVLPETLIADKPKVVCNFGLYLTLCSESEKYKLQPIFD
ncbi:MAG: hypothetical protein WC087_03115 [Candidatus Paceibacterota bacterium]